jgi:flavorubredoxin
MTYDEKTKTLFSSDLFGSYDANWSLFLELNAECKECESQRICPQTGKKCPLYGIDQFHKRIMTSNRAMGHALDVIESLDVERIAPQHGSILKNKRDVQEVIRFLRKIENVGVDYLIAEKQL